MMSLSVVLHKDKKKMLFLKSNMMLHRAALKFKLISRREAVPDLCTDIFVCLCNNLVESLSADTMKPLVTLLLTFCVWGFLSLCTCTELLLLPPSK